MKLSVVSLLFGLIALVYANSESELEQPVKLLGGIIRKPEKCTQTVSKNSKVTLHYRARTWGSEDYYENTYLAEPHSYKLGRDKIMKGLEQGIDGMCLGEVRRLLIPSDLAFGPLGMPGQVPGDTAVIYEVEVIKIDSPTRNPWFWAGLIALVVGYILQNRHAKMSEVTSSSNFVEQKEREQAKKTE